MAGSGLDMVQSLAGAVGLRLGAAFGNLHYPAFQQPYAEMSDTFLKPGCDGLQPAVTREEVGCRTARAGSMRWPGGFLEGYPIGSLDT